MRGSLLVLGSVVGLWPASACGPTVSSVRAGVPPPSDEAGLGSSPSFTRLPQGSRWPSQLSQRDRSGWRRV